MTQESKKHEEDDGRTICDMNVEGMPWHDRRERAAKSARADDLTGAQTRQAIWGAVLAGLAVVGVFSVTIVLFVLFCINVWFR